MEANWALPMTPFRLGEGQGRVIAANATPDAGKGLTCSVIARAAAETISVANFDQRSIRKRRAQRWLVVPRRLSWHWVSNTKVALEYNVARPLLIHSLTTSKKESQAAGLVLS